MEDFTAQADREDYILDTLHQEKIFKIWASPACEDLGRNKAEIGRSGQFLFH